MHGLYPFELTESGVDWIGKIPSHWRVVPFSTLDNERRYLELLIKSDRFKKNFGEHALDDESLKDILIPRPPLFEQTEIADYLEAQP